MSINYNGKITKSQKSILNRSFNYGDGIFETIKIINGEIYNADFHFNRLKQATKTVKVDFPFCDFNDFIHNINITIDLYVKNNNLGGRLKIIIFRSEGGFYLPDNNNSNFIIIFEKSETNGFKIQQKPLKLCLYNIKKQITPYSFFKSTSSLYYIMASIYFQEQNSDDALLLNNFNRIVETTNSNIFFVKKNIIKTPLIQEGCVDGSMRHVVLEILKKNNKYLIEESTINYSDIVNFDEVFITNSIKGVVSVRKINDFYYDNFNLRNKLIKEI